ncbi:MAG: serine/threonine protein kinase [Pirellulaceae bacterium]|nr:serine/threonine protein kinase [Pirellulaceae bacterium]
MANVDSDRNPLEVLAEEFAERHRRGELPSLTEYTRRYPDLADEIEQLFPTIVAMEQLKHRRLESGSGRASLGQAPLEWLGDYRIIREIGRGGMGVVYEAEQQSLGRRVAVKVLPRQATLDGKHLARFQREAQTAARLHHTNIVPVYGVGQQEGLHYYAMQFIHGLGLDKVLSELKRQESSPAADLSRPLTVPSDGGGVSAAAAALAMLDGRFSVPRKPGIGSDGLSYTAAIGSLDPSTQRRGAVRPSETEIRARELAVSEPDRALPEAPGRSSSAPPGDDPALDAAEQASEVAEREAAEVGNDASRDARPEQARASDAVPEPADEAAPRRRRPVRTRLRGNRYWRSVARIGVQVADALQYAHSQGTQHRDIKPANLLLDGEGAVWVTDFGLARALDNDRVTQTGDIVGTLRYMAPEQFNGQADARADVYSLGLTLYELLTLCPAFDADNRNQLVQQVTQGVPVRPRGICQEIPRDLETIVLKAIAREPAHRYQSAGQMAEDLHRFLEDRTILARRPSPPERLWRWCRRNQAVAALMLTAFAAMLLAAVVGWVGYVRTAHQHAEAQAATERAEDNLDLAMRAFEDIFSRISGQQAFQPLESAENEVWQEPPPEHVISTADAALLQRMLEFYDHFADRNAGNTKLALETARASRRVGDIQRRLGNFTDAEAAYVKSLDTFASLAEAAGRPTEYALERAGIRNELASIHARRREHERAAGELLIAERLLLHLPPDVGARPNVQLELVRTYNQMLNLYVRNSVLSRQTLKVASEQTVNILENLRQADPGNPDYRLAMAQCKLNQSRWSWLRRGASGRDGDATPRGPSTVSTGDGGSESAAPGPRPLPPSEEALQMFEQLVADFPDNPTYKFALAETYAHTAISQSMFRRTSLSQQRLRKSMELLAELADQYKHMPDYRASLARAHSRLGMHLLLSNRHESALRELETCASMQAELAEEYPAVPGYRLAHGWSVYMLVRFHLRQEHGEEAAELVDQVIEITAGLLEEDANNQVALQLQSEALESLADVALLLGNSAQAELAADRALEARDRLSKLRLASGNDRFRGPGGVPRFGFPSVDRQPQRGGDSEPRGSGRRDARDREPTAPETGGASAG